MNELTLKLVDLCDLSLLRNEERVESLYLLVGLCFLLKVNLVIWRQIVGKKVSIVIVDVVV